MLPKNVPQGYGTRIFMGIKDSNWPASCDSLLASGERLSILESCLQILDVRAKEAETVRCAPPDAVSRRSGRS